MSCFGPDRAWSGHPHYYRLDNENRDWPAKSAAARALLAELLGS